METDNDYLEYDVPVFEWSTLVDYVSRFGYEHATEMLGMGGGNAAHEQNMEALNEPAVDYGCGVDMGMAMDMCGSGLHGA